MQVWQMQKHCVYPMVYLVIENNNHAVLIGASTYFGCDDDWAHRFPELNEKQHKDACSSMRMFAVVR